MTPHSPWHWRLTSPPRPGAVALFDCTGNPDAAALALGFAPVPVGRLVLRSVPNLDTALVARFSPTFMQVMPHGGPAVVEAILHLLADSTGTQAQHAAYPEAASALEAEMLHALARAASPAAIDLLLQQPGRWTRALPNLDPARLPDVQPTPRDPILRRLIDPPLVVAWGHANIGKSSLCNALARREAAIVADQPGTTRDHVGVLLELDSLAVRYVDTPGVRTTPHSRIDPIERQAAATAASLATTADLILLCGDPTTPPPPSPSPSTPSLAVCLRQDLGTPIWHPDVSTSAHTSQGLTRLAQTIRERLVPDALLHSNHPWHFWQQ